MIEKKNVSKDTINAMLHDCNLSTKAKGILMSLVYKNDDSEISLESLYKENADGFNGLRSGLSELEKAGYLERSRMRNGNRLAGSKWTIKL